MGSIIDWLNIFLVIIWLYIAYKIPNIIFENEQKLNLQWLYNKLNYAIIWNLVSNQTTNEWIININKDELMNLLNDSISMLSYISKNVFNNLMKKSNNEDIFSKLWNINEQRQQLDYYSAILTMLSNYKRYYWSKNESTFKFPICTWDSQKDKDIQYYDYLDWLSIIISRALNKI